MKSRKFKLIKSYPDSENKGSIYEEGSFMGRPVYWKDGHYLDPTDVENNPEFFEEIIEKQFEILSVQNCFSDIILEFNKLGICIKRSDNCNLAATLNLEDCLKNGCKIHSIRRLSDSEVFSIGDKTEEGVILAFDIPGSNQTITRYKVDNNGHGWRLLNDAKKTKPVLFVTEDGVEIVSRQTEIAAVWRDNIKLSFSKITYDDFVRQCAMCNYLLFSTKEAAQEYILMNKRVLSIKDLLDLAKECNTVLCISCADSQSYQSDFEKVKELVKSRL